mmetsp:Transcript_5116/g.7830  ORF Transcript_5116/g.7830 Transcript_5116/m.7830 type:complete len:1332 (-) Transcript_5116:216-4211(-)
MSIGSFRDTGLILADLPPDLQSLRTGDIDVKHYPLDGDVAHLNHGAFGGSPNEFINIEYALRSRAHKNPSAFYDTLCLPLIRESVHVARDFFQGNVILQPNCTIALKSVLSSLGSDEGLQVAALAPIYGATSKLLRHLYSDITEIKPGMFCESAQEIIRLLEQAYASSKFNVLVADHVSSQSARILPMAEVVQWCRERGIISIVDGTQACWFQNDVWPDYYVLSTHKWLCNIKTCAVIRIDGEAIVPEPVGVSFGHPDKDDRHLWVGMLDYMPYILLAKALRVFSSQGADMVVASSAMLQEGFQYLGCPVLGQSSAQPSSAHMPRTMTLLRVHRCEEDLQNALERQGVCVSVKNLEGNTYLRVSCWTYNTLKDFQLLGECLNYKLRLDAAVGSTKEAQETRKRGQILEQIEAQMDLTDKLYSHLTVEAFFIRAEKLRHPLIFYYGHTAVFFINKLCLGQYLSDADRIDPELESLCAVGVDEMTWDDLTVGEWDKVSPEDQPKQLERVRNYRQRVREILRNMILNPSNELNLPITPSSIWWVFLMGIEHSRIHIETSSVIIAQLGVEYVTPSLAWPVCPHQTDKAPVNSLISVAGGVVTPGRPLNGTTYYGWDNEFGSGRGIQLESFEVSQTLVSHAEYAEFVNSGGYNNQEWWSAEGWEWAKNKQGPLFWNVNCKGNRSEDAKLRTIMHEIDLPPSWPVVTNNYEAEAFCNWKSSVLGKHVRMISHPEWLLLAKRCKRQDYNINMRKWASPCPVDMHGEPLGQDGSMVYDIRGNLWQHSRSLLTVLPEFEVHPLYDDFTLPTIDGQHSFILGGSWASLGNCADVEARYGFRRHFYQFAGIRYVCSRNEDRSAPARLVQGEVCIALSEHYMNFSSDILTTPRPVMNGMKEFGQYASTFISDQDNVLVLNGSVGRVTFEIAAHASPKSILHTDPTANALDAFLYARENGTIRYERTLEGNLCKTESYDLPSEWLDAIRKIDVSVKQVDMFRLAVGVIEPVDVAVVDLVQLGVFNCPRRAQIPPLLFSLVKEGGKLIMLRPKNAYKTSSENLRVSGFQDTGMRYDIAHICPETMRKHRFSESEVLVFTRIGGEELSCVTGSGTSSECCSPDCTPLYEQCDVVDTYEAFHYSDQPVIGVKNFHIACAEFCVELCREYGVTLEHAFDVGCGPGRLGLELSAHFKSVVSMDQSEAFVDMLESRKASNVTAVIGDALFAHNDERVGGKRYNLIVGANLVDRLLDPSAWIQSAKDLLSDDGLLVILSPFTWSKEHTPPEKWLGGFRRDAEVVYSIHGTKRVAAPELTLKRSPQEIPMAIPDADGIVQYTLSQCLVFGRQ